MKRYAEYKDSGAKWIGRIPSEWNTIRFKFLNNGLNTGEGIDKEYWTDDQSECVFYTAGLEPIYTSYKEFPEWKYTNKNDLLLARNGTPYVYYPPEGACYSDHIIRAEIKEKNDKRFVRYCLQQSIMFMVIDTVSIATWSASLWNEQIVPWPSIEEQIKIANYLDDKVDHIDCLIDEAKASIEEYKAWKASIIYEAVTKGLDKAVEMKDSGINIIGYIPKHWDYIPLKMAFDNSQGSAVRVGPFGSALSGSDIIEEGVWVYNQRTVLDNNFESNSTFVSPRKAMELNSFAVCEGDILVTTRGSIGKIAIVPEGAPQGVLHPCIIRFRTDKKIINDELLKILFNESDLMLEQMRRRSNSTTIDVLYSYSLKELRIPMIPMEEQKRITEYLVDKVKQIKQLIHEKESLITDLEAYKKSLIFETVTGKRKVV